MDFRGADNVGERLIRIAERNGGIVNPTSAAQLFIDAGLTQSKKDNMRSTIHRTLQEKPETWEKVGAGKFRLRDGGAPAPLTLVQPTTPSAV